MAAKSKLPDVAPPRNRSWLVYAVVVALLAWYFFSAVSAVADKTTTFDEVFHLTGGYTAWKFGDFRMQPENGILPQRWAALPLLFSDTRFPELDDNFWQRSDMHEIGERFFYNVGNDADRMLLRGRAMIALMGVALGALVFVWTRSLLGVAPAIASVGLFAFCPTVLANGASLHPIWRPRCSCPLPCTVSGASCTKSTGGRWRLARWQWAVCLYRSSRHP